MALNIYIDEDTGMGSDDGPFRSYTLQASGTTLREVLDDAIIWEVDQDGGDHEGPTLYGCGPKLFDRCLDIIERHFIEAMKEELWAGVQADLSGGTQKSD